MAATTKAPEVRSRHLLNGEPVRAFTQETAKVSAESAIARIREPEQGSLTPGKPCSRLKG